MMIKARKPLNILLIEDRMEDIDLAQEALSSQKINTRLHTVMDGEGAISYLHEAGSSEGSPSPDIIVLDLNLPKKNGFEVLKEIRADKRLREIPVVILTTAQPDTEMFKKHNINPQLYVRKSADFHEFAQLIKKIIEDRQAVAGDASLLLEDSLPEKAMKILLVEDNLADVDLLEDILFIKERQNWQLHNVTRLDEAFRFLEEEDVDVVALDLFLPDAQGLETLSRMRKHNSQLPIIVVTGLNDEKIGLAALRKGAQDYLVKGQITADLFIRSLEYAIERKRLEQFKDEMFSYVNHELNNPLTVVKEGISQIEEGLLGEVNEEQRKFLKKVLEHIDRLIRITDDLLMSTKLEFGKLQLEKQNFDLLELVQAVLDSYRSSTEGEIDFLLKPSQGSLMVEADRGRVEQVLMNLVGNAVKFTQKGSVQISVTDNVKEVRCALSDNGPGIKKEELGMIFDKFERSRRDQLKRVRGTGLGLYICKLLIELHGGRIWVESEPGKGTTFFFTLPKE